MTVRSSGVGPQHRVADGRRRGELVGVGRQVLEELGDGAVHVVRLHRAQAAGGGVDAGAAQLADPDLDAGEFRHHLRARDEGHRLGVHDDEVGEAEEERRTRDHGPGRGRDDGHLSAAAGDGGGGPSPAVQGGHAVEHVGPARGHEEDEWDPQLAGLVGRLGQPHPVGVGDGAAPHGAERPRNDDVAPADPSDLRRDGTDDPLADGGRLFQSGHRDRM